jgi:hypothetical protein
MKVKKSLQKIWRVGKLSVSLHNENQHNIFPRGLISNLLVFKYHVGIKLNNICTLLCPLAKPSFVMFGRFRTYVKFSGLELVKNGDCPDTNGGLLVSPNHVKLNADVFMISEV